MTKRTKPPAKIRWSPRLPPNLLRRLYESDAKGFRDLELCDDVGIRLYLRCQTFALVRRGEVECPECRSVFAVSREGTSRCPGESCDWSTTIAVCRQSISNHFAYPGGAFDAYMGYYRKYPSAKTYKAKILLIDRLIHSFHVSVKTGHRTKSIASKLLEGNKKAVVEFLDALSALDPDNKESWRQVMRKTIDSRIVQTKRPDGE